MVTSSSKISLLLSSMERQQREANGKNSRISTITAHILPNLRPHEELAGFPEAISRLDNPHLAGNFAPTPEEGHWEGLRVMEGCVPRGLCGQYLRIGPNPKFDFNGKPYHIFDGDGFIHAVSFVEGETAPSYTKRWVRTRRLLTSLKRGFDVGEIGEQGLGSFSYFAHVSDTALPSATEKGHRMGRANTAMVHHHSKLFALEEADKPYEVLSSFDGDTNLRTVGRYDFKGKLNHPVTAHPKVDPATGELVFFGYDPLQPRVNYSVATKEGELVTSLEIPLPAPVMMHDFVITAGRFSILFDMRLEFSMERIGEGKNPWLHRRNLPSRFRVLPRHPKSPDDIRWIDVKNCALFHFANAYAEDVTGSDGVKDTLVTVVGARLPTINFMQFEDHVTGTKNNKDGQVGNDFVAEGYGSQEGSGVLYVWKLSLAKGICVEEYPLTPLQPDPCDFLQIDPRLSGKKARYVYASRLVKDKSRMPKVYENSLYLIDGILKYDLEKRTVQTFAYTDVDGRTPMYGTEAVIARTSSDDVNEEDSGHLVTIVYNETTKSSQCLIINASHLKLETRIELPQRVPFGFHGLWVDF